MPHASTMHAHSPGSYSLSLVLHGAIVIAIVLSAYVFNDAGKKSTSQVIELVAGPGDNYMAEVAPALGAPDGAPDVTFPPPASLSTPAPPVAPPAPEPVVTPAPSPVVPAASTPVVPPPAKKTPPAKITAKTEPPAKAMTKAEFDKLNATKNKNLPSGKVAQNTAKPGATGKPLTAPKIGQGLAKGVLGGKGGAAGAGGTALTASAERDMMDAYFALLAQRIREAQEKPEGLSSELVVRIEFFVDLKGNIGAVKIIRSSGNRAFDDSVLKAIRSVRSIGDRPDGKSNAKVADFRMKEEGAD